MIEKLSPLFRDLLSGVAMGLASLTEWGASSLLVQVTLPPGGTVTGDGMKANPAMATAPADGCPDEAVSAGTALGIDVGVGAAVVNVVGGAAAVSLSSPPHAPSARTNDRPTSTTCALVDADGADVRGDVVEVPEVVETEDGCDQVPPPPGTWGC